MHTGMLWFENSETALNIKILKAVEYYLGKYGKAPDLILIHPSMLDGEHQVPEKHQVPGELNCSYRVGNDPHGELKAQKVKFTVRQYRPVLPGHIWIGIEDKN